MGNAQYIGIVTILGTGIVFGAWVALYLVGVFDELATVLQVVR